MLAGYGTGAVMAVPCGDQRDYDFAQHFDIPIKNIFANTDISKEAYAEKSEDITRLGFKRFEYKEAMEAVIAHLEKIENGEGPLTIVYAMRFLVAGVIGESQSLFIIKMAYLSH